MKFLFETIKRFTFIIFLFSFTLVFAQEKIRINTPKENKNESKKSNPAFAQVTNIYDDKTTTLTVTAFMEQWFGNIYELVFENHKYLSELIWSANTINIVGVNLNVISFWDLFLDAEVSMHAIPLFGTMEDSDWMGFDLNRKTHFSKHDTRLLLFKSAQGRFGKQFKIVGSKSQFSIVDPSIGFFLSPSVGFRFYAWAWEAFDGYTQYPETFDYDDYWHEDREKMPFNGVGVTFNQEVFFPDLGLDFTVKYNNMFTTSILAFYSPFVSINSIDNHHSRLKIFYDFLRMGQFLETTLAFSYSPTSLITMFLEGGGFFIFNLRGDTALNENNSELYHWSYAENGNGSGAKANVLRLRLGLSFNF